MPTYHEGCICLSKEESERFARLVEHPDPGMIERRDAFLAEIDCKIEATQVQNGVILQIKGLKGDFVGDVGEGSAP